MKYLISITFIVFAVLPAQACNYGGYSAGYSLGFQYAAPAFYAQAPVQAQIQYLQPLALPVTTIQYQYSAPLSAAIQYTAAPIYAPVQPYFANFNVGGYRQGFSNFDHNRNFAFNNHHHNQNFRNFNNRGFSFSIRR